MKHNVVFSFSLSERSSSDLLWRTEKHQTFIVINVHSKGSWEGAQKLIHNKIVPCNGRTYCLAKVYKKEISSVTENSVKKVELKNFTQ